MNRRQAFALETVGSLAIAAICWAIAQIVDPRIRRP